MCGLCSNDTVERESTKHDLYATHEELRKLAQYYHDLSIGKTDPHTKSEGTSRRARSIIRRLVRDWVR
jgi:hypothetical protein